MNSLLEKTIILVGVYFINNSRGRTSFNGRFDFQGIVFAMDIHLDGTRSKIVIQN